VLSIYFLFLETLCVRQKRKRKPVHEIGRKICICIIIFSFVLLCIRTSKQKIVYNYSRDAKDREKDKDCQTTALSNTESEETEPTDVTQLILLVRDDTNQVSANKIYVRSKNRSVVNDRTINYNRTRYEITIEISY